MPGMQDVPIRVPAEWDRALPGFSTWFTRFVRDVLAKGDIRNAIAGGTIQITADGPTTVATISDDHTGVQVFSARPHQAPRDHGQEVGELRTFLPPLVISPVNYADTQQVLALKIFGVR